MLFFFSFYFNSCLTEIYFIYYKIHFFKRYNLVAFSVLTALCDHHHDWKALEPAVGTVKPGRVRAHCCEWLGADRAWLEERGRS